MKDQTDGRVRDEINRGSVLQPLLTVKEVADYFRLTPSALYVQRHRGEQPGTLGIRVGKRILYRPSDLDQYLNERRSEKRPRSGT